MRKHLLLMLALLLTRMPVAYVMALVGFGGFSYLTTINGGLNLLPRNIYEGF